MRKRVCGFGTLCLLALSYMLDTEGVFPLLLIAALLHELGHVTAACACGARVRGFEPVPFGFVLRFDGLLPYRCDAVIAAGGALLNLLAAFCLSVAGKYLPWRAALHAAAGVNLLLGLFHLLPAQPLDGGRVLYALLAQRMAESTAFWIVRGISCVVGIAIGVLGVYILIKTRYNVSILAISGLILGGTYAQRSGNRSAKGAKTGTLRRRRIRADQKRSEPDRRAGGILFSGRL